MAQRWVVYALCGAATVVEGFNLSAAGLAAPRFSIEFNMTPDRVGLIFLLTSIGLAVGASVGGWCGDRFSAARMLPAALVFMGLSSIGTALAPDAVILGVMRTLTGVGLGAALPNIFSLLGAAGPARLAPRRVTMSVAGISIGSIIVAFFSFIGPAYFSWRSLFQVGGWIPLILALATGVYLPRVDLGAAHLRDENSLGRAKVRDLIEHPYRQITLLFWLAFFVTAGTSYVMVNWTPTFLLARGLSARQAALGMMFLSVGGALGPAVLATLMRSGRSMSVVCVAYLGTLAALGWLIAAPKALLVLYLAVGVTGFFTAGAQACLFGVVGPFYPISIRGSGVGSAVAIGRLGSGVGPMLVGLMLAAGLTQRSVLVAVVPVVILALIVLLVLLQHRPVALR